MNIYVNGGAFQPVGDVQHLPSIWYFYVLKLIFWLPKQHRSWPRDSILQCNAGLASKGVGRLLDTVNFFMTILLQCPFFRERKPTSGRIIYALVARHRRLFISGQWRQNGHHPFRRNHILFNITRLAKVPSKSQYVSIIENDHVSPLRKEPALCLRQIKKGNKVAVTSEGEIGKGRCSCCRLPLLRNPLMWSKRLLYDGLPTASVLLSLQTEYIFNKSFCIHNHYAGDFMIILLSVEATDLGCWRFLLDNDNMKTKWWFNRYAASSQFI